MSKLLNILISFARSLNAQINGLLAGAQKTDTFFIVGFALISLVAAMVFRRRKIIIFSVAIYVVTALYQALPFDWGMRFGNNVWIFLAAVAIMFFILKSSIASNFYNSSPSDYTGRIKTFLLAVIVLGFLTSSVLNFVTSVDVLSKIEMINRVFSGDISRLIWAVLPIIGFLFLR